MAVLFYILGFSFLVSAISLVGVLILILKKKSLDKTLLFWVAFSAGALMASAFLDILPEASEKMPGKILFAWVLISFVAFFLIEKVFHWRHCHKGQCHEHIFGYLNLIGDGAHNFIDGLIIAGAFLTDVRLGVLTSIAIAFHEIPQEIGDFGVLLYAGFGKRKALAFNFLSALLAIAGALFGYFLGKNIQLANYLLPFAAGSFIYIATSDLIPEINKEQGIKKSIFLFLYFLAGISVIYLAGKIL